MPMKVRYTTVNGEIIAEKRDGVRRSYVPDPLGSTVALLDNTQTKTDTFQYWPYGEERSRTGTTPTPFRFLGSRGYYRDSPARTYVRARHLNSAKASWLTTDPLAFRGRDVPGRQTMYAYAGDSPTVSMDPSGMFPVIPFGICGCCAKAIHDNWSMGPDGEPTWYHKCNHMFVHCIACCVLTRAAGALCARVAQDLQDRFSKGKRGYPLGPGDLHKCRIEACNSGIACAVSLRSCFACCSHRWPFDGPPNCSSKNTGPKIDCGGRSLPGLPTLGACLWFK
jgi:RHS repeat-associated protein